MWLTGNLRPKYHTIADFRKHHPRALKAVFKEYILLLKLDTVQDQILAPGDPVMRWIDRACGRLDEYLIAGLRQQLQDDVLRRGRMLAWSV